MAPLVDVAGSPKSKGAHRHGPAATCDHCGLRIPERRHARGDRFCCDGCARVYALLHEEGLERYYELRRGGTAPPPDLRPDGFAWLERLPADGPPASRRRTLDVQGIHCAACVWVLQELFRRHPAAGVLTLNPGVGRAELTWNDERAPLTEYLREAERFGYRFGPPRKGNPIRSRGLLVRLAVCSAAAMNTMIFSLSFYFGLAPTDGLLPKVFGGLEIALGTLAAVVGGGVFIRSAIEGLRRRIVHLDLPIALGVVLAWAGSLHQQLVRGPQSGYFDTVSIFVTLMLLGRWLQERQLERNRLALLAADGVAGLSTRRLAAGRLDAIPAVNVMRGDELWIAPGDLVPVEGALLDRRAEIRLDWIDGEPRPRGVEPGEAVPAGAFNAGRSPVRLVATQDFADSRLHDLLSRPAPERGPGAGGLFWRRLGTAWVAGVLLCAAAGFLVWFPRGASRALEVTVSILVVTCPCAIGLASPLARDLVHGALRRRGVFVRNATFLDRALGVRRVIFDKTGTLTRDGVALTPDSRRRLAMLPEPERETLRTMALCSNHPVSREVARILGPDRAARDARAGEPAAPFAALNGASDVEPPHELPGHGIEWRTSTTTWRLGRRSFALQDDTLASDGGTWWTADGTPHARLETAERFRPDAGVEIHRLASAGLDVRILSGDAPERVAAAARRLGLPEERAFGGLSPEQKAEVVRGLDHGDTLFIGDGLNDGPAFDAAACAGTPAVDHAALPGRADFYFLGGGLGAVRFTLHAARTLRGVQRTNLVISTAYNAVALALCFAGLIRPAIAAVLMPASSLAVVSLTLARLSEARRPWK